jgi:hypothetical protein
MANTKPKVAKVLMKADPDPYSVVQVYFKNDLSEEEKLALQDQTFRLSFSTSNNDNFPPHDIMERGEFQDGAVELNVRNPADGTTHKVECLLLRFRIGSEGTLEYDGYLSNKESVALMYSTDGTNPADNKPILFYSALFPEESNPYSVDFLFHPLHKK